MPEIKVVVAENQSKPMPVLRESLKQNGFKVVLCSNGFDALDEIINSGGSILVLADQLPDITGAQISCLLKCTSVTSSLPVVLVLSSDDDDDSFWSRASLADSILKRTQVEQNEQDFVKLIKRLTMKKSYGVSPTQLKNEPVIAGNFGGGDLLRLITSFGGLLDGLLAERLVRHYMRRLCRTLRDRAEFTTEFFDFLSRVFKPDVCGIIVNANEPWSVYHIAKSINSDRLEALINSTVINLGLKAEVPAVFYGGTLDKKGPKLRKARILEVISVDGTKIGAILLGWTGAREFDTVFKTTLEHLKDQMATVLQILVEKGGAAHLPVEAHSSSKADPAARLHSMEFFNGYLQQLIFLSHKKIIAVGLCIIDVDGFVALSLQYGTEKGEMLLKRLSERLSKCIRPGDVMTRYDGDQFAVVLPNTDINGVMNLAEQMRLEIEKMNPGEIEGEFPMVTVSVGCAQFSGEYTAPEALIGEAKQALRRAKDKGRNCISD